LPACFLPAASESGGSFSSVALSAWYDIRRVGGVPPRRARQGCRGDNHGYRERIAGLHELRNHDYSELIVT